MLWRQVCRTETFAAIVGPDGVRRKIPAWMLEPPAAQLDIRVPPRLSYECLLDLRGALDVALRMLNERNVPDTPSQAGEQ